MTRTAKTVTPHGSGTGLGAQIDTAQSKFGGASGLFDGTDDYLSLEDSPDWYFSTGDFTIEFRVRFNSLPNVGNTESCVYCQYVDTSNRIRFGFYSTDGINVSPVATVISGGVTVLNRGPVATIVVNTWYHFAFVRSGSTHYIFQDGVQLDSASMSGVVPNLASSLYVGTLSGASQYFNGWLDELRVTKGLARWTANFTPPTAPHTPDGYDVLLLPMDGADASTTFLDCPCAVEGTINDRLTGTAISGATVELFKSSDLTHVGAVAGSPYTSESTGRYIFRVSDPAIAYFVRAFKDGSPNLFGVTDDNLVGA